MQQDERIKNKYEKWKAIRSSLQEKDFERVHGVPYINRIGWFKIASYFGLSFEIKDAERKEENSGGKKKITWRYRVRVSSPDNSFAEAEGVASSDEFVGEKSENYLSSLAQTRAYTRAISFFVGSGEFSAEELGSDFTKVQTKPSQQVDIIQEQEVVERWEENERKLEKEILNYSEAVSEEFEENGGQQSQSDIQNIKLPPTKRSEIFNQVKELMTSIGLKTPEERKKYASDVLGKDVGRGMSLSDGELMILLKKLKSDVMKKKVS
ncbi:MAG: hypothetical protein NZ927_07415 [Candidatus Calescibacterium sp.]|nr:hypothetical protein [Candidatus Calescibacterium sp.]MCX7734487.1 hypothetical protein [bacterium]MDW8087319.1 hypothetical protein [Candidatus Calescibacterium sp.]